MSLTSSCERQGSGESGSGHSSGHEVLAQKMRVAWWVGMATCRGLNPSTSKAVSPLRLSAREVGVYMASQTVSDLIEGGFIKPVVP